LQIPGLKGMKIDQSLVFKRRLRMALSGLLFLCLVALAGCHSHEREASADALTAPLPTPTPTPEPTIDPRITDLERVKEGTPAPDFALEDIQGKLYRLSDYKGKKAVVLIFYRGYF